MSLAERRVRVYVQRYGLCSLGLPDVTRMRFSSVRRGAPVILVILLAAEPHLQAACLLRTISLAGQARRAGGSSYKHVRGEGTWSVGISGVCAT